MIQTAGFDIDEVAPDELKAAALRTYEALLKKWERERIDADTHYRIDIPFPDARYPRRGTREDLSARVEAVEGARLLSCLCGGIGCVKLS